MKYVNLDWEEFVSKLNSKEIKPWVDINKGHALMKSPFAPSHWRWTIKVMTPVVLLAIPASVLLFFFVKWWIPLIIITVSISTMKALRQESAKAVVEISVENKKFYQYAIGTATMKLISDDEN